jgi:hypothetical protein
MGYNGFLFYFSCGLLMLGTILFGGILILVAWIAAARNATSISEWKGPSALLPLTMSVALYLVLFVCLSVMPSTHRFAVVKSFLMLFTVIASVTSLLFSMLRLRWDSGPGTKLLSIGTKLLLVFTLICFVGIAIGLPGEIDTWRY